MAVFDPFDQLILRFLHATILISLLLSLDIILPTILQIIFLLKLGDRLLRVDRTTERIIVGLLTWLGMRQKDQILNLAILKSTLI